MVSYVPVGITISAKLLNSFPNYFKYCCQIYFHTYPYIVCLHEMLLTEEFATVVAVTAAKFCHYCCS